MALRILARKSATGSVKLIASPYAARSLRLSGEPATTIACLPGRLGDAGDLSLERQPTKAQAADAELAQVSARASANAAAVVPAAGKFGLACVFDSFCCSRHELRFLVSSFLSHLLPKRHAH